MKCKSSIAELHISKYLNIYPCWLVLVLAHISAVGAVKCFTLFHCSSPTPQHATLQQEIIDNICHCCRQQYFCLEH